MTKKQAETILEKTFEEAARVHKGDPNYWRLFDEWIYEAVRHGIQIGIIQPQDLY